MGQSALRDKRTRFSTGGVARLRPRSPKGNLVNIPEPRHGDWCFGAQCGNATELGDAGVGPGKSSLFLVRSRSPESVRPEIGLEAP